MKASRLVVAGIAGVSAVGALLMSNISPPPPAPQAPIASAPNAPVEPMRLGEVLVAATELAMGAVLQENDLKWAQFPESALSPHYVQRRDSPNAIQELAGSIARQPFLTGEPLRREKLIRGNGSGFLAAILPAGKRAVAITTDASGATSAGGFVLPNDRVDVVRTYRDEDATKARGAEVFKSEIVLSNVRVLAIGQNIQERNGERFITSQTATLELDPKETEQVMWAQRVGTLSLALRSLQDASRTDEAPQTQKKDGSLMVVRFGVAQEASPK
jgi:pilus assembly protein CpaB